VDLDAIARRDAELSRAFDRAWAQSTMRRAAERQAELAQKSGEAAIRRVELLRLRFHEGLTIREIASRWGEYKARLHHEYASARQEFKKALLEVIAFHHPGSPKEVEQECAALLDRLH
jgi:RNA polymerase sigma-70 factor (ECF subfamily)